MTEPAATQVFDPSIVPDDSIFSFDTDEWIDPPTFVTELPETSPETNIRILGEKEYRESVTPTRWHRYIVLGRYAMDGFTFDTLMENIDTEPKTAFCAIWYHFNYFLDREMEVSVKLQQWVQHRVQPYLSKHAYATFQVDTLRTTWKDYARRNALPNPWEEVQDSKKKKRSRQKAKVLNPYKKSSQRISTPATIPEEECTNSNTTGGSSPTLSKKCNKDDVSAASSADGKMSALIPESHVPVCDGTKRVCFRWKLPIELSRISSQSTEIQSEIYTVLNEFFSDYDGSIYDWSQEGVDRNTVISKLSPSELRSYLPSTISISAERQITVQVRFGFFGTTPSKWRNLDSTKEKLDRYKVTVSISNSTSTSGKLLIAGYILLKAPMTTHRVRYLQALRQALPENTPPFDILLHKRPPVSDEVIPHLVVQCGTKHVHALSEALCYLLTGKNSALFMPRMLVADMPDEKLMKFFHQHNIYCKDLRSHALSPLLRNLDKARKEYNPNGSLSIERTAREWARSLTPDTSEFHFDVVNGGPDQLAYLLFPSEHAELAASHVETYRQRLYPRRKREDQFKKDVGPPKTVHLSTRVIANLEFMERLCLKNPEERTSSNTSKVSDADASSSVSDTTASSVTQASNRPPPTSLEALRAQLKERERGNLEESSVNSASSELSEGSDRSEDTTTASTKSGKSKDSSRMSTSSAKVRQLDEVLKRYKTDSAHLHAKQSERVSQMERQLHRVHEFDSKLDSIQTDFVARLNLFEGRMEETMNSNMAKLLALVQNIHPSSSTRSTSPSNRAQSTTHRPHMSPTSADSTALEQINHPDSDGSSTMASSSSKASVMTVESVDPIQSPDHKKLKSTGKGARKIKLKDSIRRRLDEINDSHTSASVIATQDSSDSLDLIVLDEMDSIMAPTNLYKPPSKSAEHGRTIDDSEAPCSSGADRSTSRQESVSTANLYDDPESQYKACHDMNDDPDATSSPGRRSTP